MVSSAPRVFVALDFADPAQALALAERLDPRACGLKIGKEMFVVAGPAPVRRMVERGFNVFLDLKFHDIPNTAAQACAAATRLGVFMLNVHAGGGRAMLAAARAAVTATAAAQGGAAPLLIAVTSVSAAVAPAVRAAARTASATRSRVAVVTGKCPLVVVSRAIGALGVSRAMLNDEVIDVPCLEDAAPRGRQAPFARAASDGGL
jgi:orotidine-5'-phosphate decarboxylase